MTYIVKMPYRFIEEYYYLNYYEAKLLIYIASVYTVRIQGIIKKTDENLEVEDAIGHIENLLFKYSDLEKFINDNEFNFNKLLEAINKLYDYNLIDGFRCEDEYIKIYVGENLDSFILKCNSYHKIENLMQLTNKKALDLYFLLMQGVRANKDKYYLIKYKITTLNLKEKLKYYSDIQALTLFKEIKGHIKSMNNMLVDKMSFETRKENGIIYFKVKSYIEA